MSGGRILWERESRLRRQRQMNAAVRNPRVCRACGERLVVMNRAVRYCSDVCRHGAARERRREQDRRYDLSHRAERRAYAATALQKAAQAARMRRWRAENPERRREMDRARRPSRKGQSDGSD